MSMNLTKTSFFKSLVAFAAAGVMATTGFAQSQNYSELPVKTLSARGHASQASVEASQAEQMPMSEATINDDQTGKVSLDAQWDLQVAFATSDTVGYFSNAGAFWTGTEFWTSKWNSDTLARLNATGQLIEIFTVPGVSGTRSITSDGTNVYLGLATDQIAVVDPVTKTLTSAITITGGAAGIGSRVCTYDPTLDGGNGGFYIANFTSDIGAVTMTGTTIGVIDAATHGRLGMYGGAVDNISAGGPYLWVFEQSANPSDAMISQLALPSGTWTGVSFDVDGDLGLGGTALAGGLFVGSGLVAGQNTIGGMAQGTPNVLFGYELDFVPIQIDALLAESNMIPGLSIVPKNQIPAYSFTGEVANFGQSGISSATLDVEVEDLEDNSIVFTQSAALGLIPSLGTVPYNVGSFTPVDTGAYFVTVTAGTGAQTDENLANNDDFFGIFVSDSTVARDQGPGISNFGVGAGANQNAVLAHSLTIQQTDYLTSVTMVFGAPPVNQQVFATIYAANPGGGPQATPIASTTVYTFTQDDADNGLVLTLPVAGQPQPLPPGDFYIGVNELAENIGILVTGGIVTDGALWFRADNIGTGGWNQATNAVVLAVRGNFGPCHSALTATVVIDDDDAGNSDASLSIQVSGGSGGYMYQWDDPALSTAASVTGVPGGRIYNVTVTDSEGCTKTFSSDLVGIWATSVEEELGISAFTAYPNPARNEVFAKIEMDNAQTVTIAMYDQRGRIVYSKEIKNAINIVESINVSDYPAGIYSLQLTTNEGSVMRKISVE